MDWEGHNRPWMKAYWRRGLATEAAQAIIDFGKTELKQTAFFCCHAKDNPASGKVMRKAGFQYQKDGTYCSAGQEREIECREYLLEIKKNDGSMQ